MIQRFILLILDFFDFFYKKKIVKFLIENNFNKFDVLLDVGGHKGESIYFFLKNFKVNKIVSFEASPDNFKILEKKKNFISRKYSKTEIIIENIALGSEKKMANFNQLSESSSSTFNEINLTSMYYKKKNKILNLFDKKKNIKTIQIEVETLKNYLKKKNIHKIELLKIDTEGYEYEVLKGLDDMIVEINMIIFEHHYDDMINKGYKFRDINNLLLSNRFKQIFKIKMPFRKTFDYIYLKQN